MNGHEDYEGLAAGYALHALEPEDEQRLAAHLVGCERCAHLVADTAAIGAALASVVPPADDIPPALRERILSAASAEPQEAVPGRSELDDLPFPPARPARLERGWDEDVSTGRVVLPFERPAHGWRSKLAVAVLAAAVAVGVAVPVTLAASGGQATSTAQNASLAQWLLSPGAREIRLTPPNNAAGTGTATAVVTNGGLLVVVDGLAVNDTKSNTYVLWGTGVDGTPQAMATFDVKGGTPVEISVEKPPLPTAELSQVAVSYEAGRKAPAKPTKVLLAGSVA